MSTPLHSASIGAVFSRGVVIELSPMSSDPARADLTLDFALQLILEAHLYARVRPEADGFGVIFDDLVAQYADPGQSKAFCNAAGYYIYYIATVATFPSTVHSTWSSLTLAIGTRLPWLVTALRPGMLWESAAYSFAMSPSS